MLDPIDLDRFTPEALRRELEIKGRSRAEKAHREEIEEGAAALGVDLAEHIGVVLEAMQGQAEALGLAGDGPGSA